MYSELLKKVTNLGNPKILLVGDFMLDSYVYGDALRISPEAPVPVLKIVRREDKCGGAASVAADIAAMGGECICVGLIGDDSEGVCLKKLLEETNSDTDGLIISKNRPTTSKQRLVGLAQHRHQQQLMRVDQEDSSAINEEENIALLEVFKSKLASADIVCLQDYNKGVLSPKITQEFIKLAKDAGKMVLVDPPLHNDYSKFKGATLITPNRQETSCVVGFSIETIDDAKRAADILLEKYELDAAVITLDKDGAFLKSDTLSELVPTIAKTVYDVTGAGDMVLAALATALAGGCNLKSAVEISNIAGGLEVEKFGVATVSIDEIINEIIARSHSKTGKIHETKSLEKIVEYHRRLGEKIVFTNGCFDVIHRGHIEYLSFTKRQGDIVVLGLNSDASVKRLKGPERPINNQHDRAAVLAALESVDYITIFDEDTPANLIELVKPDVLVKGADWKDKGVVGQEFVESRGGKVVLAEIVEGKSSTNTIEKMNSLGEN